MIFKTKPYTHQLTELEAHGLDPSRALFWEMGCGKTKEVLDQAQLLREKNLIGAILVLAPNGVHQNWITDEIPAHWPQEIPIKPFCWSGKRARNKEHEREAEAALSSAFPFVAMSYDSFVTDLGKKFAYRLLESRETFFVLDESARIKSPSAKRTKAVVVAGRRAKYKRILTGTPVANGPFDVYSQLKFLDEGYWKDKGFASYEAFRTYFGIWEQAITGTGQRFNRCVRYRNLEQLHSLVQGIASRVTKEEVLDLPPKLYTKRYHELSSAQEAAYVALRDQLMMELDSGELLTTELVVVRLLRLQQVLSGFLPTESGFPTWLVEPDDNPRLKILKEILDEAPAKVIVWARFRNDVDLITNALGEEAVRYDGSTSEEKRLEARERFQNDERKRYFVGNPAAAGEGLTLHAASTVVYYSNSFNLTHRLQSEDRAHRIGQRSPVTYVDLIAAKTVDEHIVRKLRHKLDLASKITGDEVRTWL